MHHKTAHERTDKLFICTESPELGEKTIVANLTNVYEVGQVAGIAQLGTCCLKGRFYRRYLGSRLRMAMGPVDAALDADLSQQFEADAAEGSYMTVEVTVTSRYAQGAESLRERRLGRARVRSPFETSS